MKRFALVLLAVSFVFPIASFATKADEDCKGILSMQSDFFDQFVDFSARHQTGRRVASGDMFQIQYKNGTIDNVVLRVEQFRGSPGHGEPAPVTDRVYLPVFLDGVLNELLVTEASLSRIKAAVYLGRVERDQIPTRVGYGQPAEHQSAYFLPVNLNVRL